MRSIYCSCAGNRVYAREIGCMHQEIGPSLCVSSRLSVCVCVELYERYSLAICRRYLAQLRDRN